MDALLIEYISIWMNDFWLIVIHLNTLSVVIHLILISSSIWQQPTHFPPIRCDDNFPRKNVF